MRYKKLKETKIIVNPLHPHAVIGPPLALGLHYYANLELFEGEKFD